MNVAKFGNVVVGRNESVTLRETISKIAISNYHKSSKWVSQSDSQEEAALIEFVANIGINLSLDSGSLGNNNISENYLLNFDDNSTQSIEVALIITPNIEANRDTCIVIFKNKLKDTVEVIVRGNYESMKKIVKSDAQTGMFEAAYTYNFKQGLSTHVYASRTVSKELLHKWVTKFKENQTTVRDKEQNFQELVDSIQSQIQMDILVGLECVPIEGAPETIDYLKQMGTKIHMLSADTKEKCVRACYQLNVFNSVKDSTTYYLDFTDKFSGETQIKPIIEELNQTVQALNLRPEHGEWQILKTQDSRVASETLSRFLHLVLVVSS